MNQKWLGTSAAAFTGSKNVWNRYPSPTLSTGGEGWGGICIDVSHSFFKQV